MYPVILVIGMMVAC